ncbi:MAG: hypothetical protein P8N94_06640 [Gammaproteobacteria bacterium]|nr:hypothetical protein [Gammaproteobacteria bacterium]
MVFDDHLDRPVVVDAIGRHDSVDDGVDAAGRPALEPRYGGRASVRLSVERDARGQHPTRCGNRVSRRQSPTPIHGVVEASVGIFRNQWHRGRYYADQAMRLDRARGGRR